jgi:hypothetical protein
MKPEKPPAPPIPRSARDAAIIAADDTGLLSGEIAITDAELREGEVTPIE